MLNMSKVQKYKSYLTHHNNKGLFSGPVADGVMTKYIIDLSDDDLNLIQSEWNIIKDANARIHKTNTAIKQTILKQIEEFCFDLGYPTYVKGHGGEVIGEHAEFKSMLKQLEYRMPASDAPPTPAPKAIRFMGEDLKPEMPFKTLQEFVAAIRPVLAKREQKKLEQDLAAAEARAKSVAEFASAAEKIKARLHVRKTTDADKKKWLEQNYPVNSPVAIDLCDDCDKWLFGHKTCSCGRHYIEYRVVGEPGAWELKFYSTSAALQPLMPDFSDIAPLKAKRH